jgi:hypothetical protein
MDDEPSVFIGRKFIDQLTDYQRVNKYRNMDKFDSAGSQYVPITGFCDDGMDLHAP